MTKSKVEEQIALKRFQEADARRYQAEHEAMRRAQQHNVMSSMVGALQPIVEMLSIVGGGFLLILAIFG